MLLSKGEMFADMPAKTVRDELRRFLQVSFSRIETISDAAWAKLLERKMIVPDKRDDGFWHLDTPGYALCNARIGKPISRTKATALIDELLQRAKEINQDEEFPVTIDRIGVFGSYARGADQVGDVDIALCKHVMPFDESGLGLYEWLAMSDKATRRLKNRSPYLSFHTLDGLPSHAADEVQWIWPVAEIADDPE